MPLDALFTNPVVCLLSFFPPDKINSGAIRYILQKGVTIMSKISEFIGLWYVCSYLYIVIFGSFFSPYSIDEVYIQLSNAFLAQALFLYVSFMWPATGLQMYYDKVLQ